MERTNLTDIILIGGIIVAAIWLFVCLFLEGKKRKYVIRAGILIDLVLLIICRNGQMLCVGVLGGLFCGLIPFVSTRKYEMAVQEMKGVRNWVVVSVIFCVMLFMVVAIAYPHTRIVWKN